MLDNSNVKDIKVYLSYFWCLFSYSNFFFKSKHNKRLSHLYLRLSVLCLNNVGIFFSLFFYIHFDIIFRRGYFSKHVHNTNVLG